MAPSRRIVAIVALAALAFTACSNNDAKESDIRDAMTDVGLPDSQADCVSSQLFDELDQDELNDLASATDPDDFDEETSQTVDSVLNECVIEADTSDSTDTTGTDGTESDGGDTTETTGDGATSTTSAGG
jgi:hypothetical protein